MKIIRDSGRAAGARFSIFSRAQIHPPSCRDLGLAPGPYGRGNVMRMRENGLPIGLLNDAGGGVFKSECAPGENKSRRNP
jgi:hypothetical protein